MIATSGSSESDDENANGEQRADLPPTRAPSKRP